MVLEELEGILTRELMVQIGAGSQLRLRASSYQRAYY